MHRSCCCIGCRGCCCCHRFCKMFRAFGGSCFGCDAFFSQGLRHLGTHRLIVSQVPSTRLDIFFQKAAPHFPYLLCHSPGNTGILSICAFGVNRAHALYNCAVSDVANIVVGLAPSTKQNIVLVNAIWNVAIFRASRNNLDKLDTIDNVEMYMFVSESSSGHIGGNVMRVPLRPRRCLDRLVRVLRSRPSCLDRVSKGVSEEIHSRRPPHVHLKGGCGSGL